VTTSHSPTPHPSWLSVSLDVCEDTRKQFSCLVRLEKVELDIGIELPEDCRIEPVQQVGCADEQVLEL